MSDHTTDAPEQGVITTRPQQGNPFARGPLADHINAGTVSIESERAIAEAQGALVVAKRFPRNEARAFSRVMDSCRRPALAAVAIYKYPKGGESVSGPSIRLAEELARAWGNIDFGIRELSRKDGVSEMEAYAWDLETNTKSAQRFTVRHVIDTRNGQRTLRDEREVYEVTANQGGRRLRARILAIIPPDLVDAAVEECRKTMQGNNSEPLADRVRKMLRAFEKLGVPPALIEKHLGHALDATTAEELGDLIQIHNSIRDGMTSASAWFGGEEAEKPRKKPAIREAVVAEAPAQEVTP